MTRTILGGLAISALLIAAPLSAASAADMPVKAPPPPPAPVFSWTGFYIGGYAGGAWTGPATTSDPCDPTFGAGCLGGLGNYNGLAPASYNFDTSFTGGGEIGYNWQPTAFTLLGFENKYGYMRLDSSIVANPPPIGIGDTSYHTRIGDWYDAYTARVGAVTGHFLFFLEGGGAIARVSTGVVDTNPIGATINTSTSKTISGWAGGGGIEYAIDSNWSIKGEYLAMGLHSTVNHCGEGFAGGIVPIGVFCSSTKVGGVELVDVGLNYRFGVTPVVAKY
jgi:outer membrane immunogenic protein